MEQDQIIDEKLPPIDTSSFAPIYFADLEDTLNLTIKKDKYSKVLTFLVCLSAYAPDKCQLNLAFVSPSSSGKSFIPMEIAQLFPEQDLKSIAYCSPTAFFHDHSNEYDKENNQYVINLERKILLFLDQPHTILLQHLRPLLSHDAKSLQLKVTDKTMKYGLKTKNIKIIGYPAVCFCSANPRMDAQEKTRFILASAEVSQEKISQSIYEKILKESDVNTYNAMVNADPKRRLLKTRIQAVKESNIRDIIILQAERELALKMFKERIKGGLKPRHQRDIGKIASFIKLFCLLNQWHRESKGLSLLAHQNDVEQAFTLWDGIYEAQEMDLPPYILDLYRDVVEKAFLKKNQNNHNAVLGLTRQEILTTHYEVYGRVMADFYLRQQILPVLEASGLVYQEPDDLNRRKMLVYLTDYDKKRNSESDGGVEHEDYGDLFNQDLSNLDLDSA